MPIDLSTWEPKFEAHHFKNDLEKLSQEARESVLKELRPILEEARLDGEKPQVWVKELATWPDPLTLPQSKIDGFKICFKFMWNTLYLEVHAITDKDLEKMVAECFESAAVLGAFVGLGTAVTMGPGPGFANAGAVFAQALGACLAAKAISASIRFPQHPRWSEWTC